MHALWTTDRLNLLKLEALEALPPKLRVGAIWYVTSGDRHPAEWSEALRAKGQKALAKLNDTIKPFVRAFTDSELVHCSYDEPINEARSRQRWFDAAMN